MKKVLIMVIALLLLMPVVSFAATQKDNCDPKKESCVVIPSEGDDDAIESRENTEEGTVTKVFPVYVEQPNEKEISSVTITITYESEAIMGHSFSAASPYQLSKEGKTATFAVPSGTEGKNGKKIIVGYVEIIVNTAADDCSFGYTSSISVVKTGAFINYLTLVGGAVIVTGIYTATKSKKKMYNI